MGEAAAAAVAAEFGRIEMKTATATTAAATLVVPSQLLAVTMQKPGHGQKKKPQRQRQSWQRPQRWWGAWLSQLAPASLCTSAACPACA